MNFGAKMAAMRAIRNQSQIAVSYLSGVSQAYINRAENGKRQLNLDEQFKVRLALDWPEELDALLEQIEQGGYVK